MIACGGKKLPVFFENEEIPMFEMMNQNGKMVSHHEMRDKVVVVNFFFSTCPGVCKELTAHMRNVQDVVKNMWDVHLISFSVDPEADSVAALKAYSIRQGVIPDKWDLLTGKDKEVFTLAQEHFHVSTLKDEAADGGIFHDERLILLDKRGRIRGFYHIKDSLKQKQLLMDIQYLRNEEK
jgi:protein SCO1/2